MKKTLFSLIVLASMMACNNSESSSSSTPSAPVAESKDANDISKHPDFAKGYEVISSSDCATCHKIEGRIQGPSYTEVADKYAGDAASISGLAEKIIKGGNGVWGKDVMMTPHPGISQADAEAAVKYIFLFKTKK